MHTLFWVSYAAWAMSEVVISIRTRGNGSGERRDRGSKPVVIASIIGAILLAWWLAITTPWARLLVARPVSLGIGAGVVLAGVGFRLWAVETLGRQFRTAVTLLDGHRLIQAGPYARIRHPSYTGALATCLGFGIGLGNWLSLAVMTLVPLFGFLYRIRVEETLLAGHFGAAWNAYCNRAGTLLPRLH